MEEKQKVSTVPTEEILDAEAPDPMALYQELKSNSVSKEEFERMKAERNRYFKMYTQGYRPEQEEVSKPKKSVNELRKEFFTMPEEANNLEYWKKVLELRNSVIEEGGKDPFVPSGSKISPTHDDYEAAKRVAEGIQYAIDESENDPESFNRILNKIII